MKHSEKMRVISEERYIALLNNSKNNSKNTLEKDNEVIQEGGQEQEQEPEQEQDNQRTFSNEDQNTQQDTSDQDRSMAQELSKQDESKSSMINDNQRTELTERMNIERVLINIPKSLRAKSKRLLEYILSYPGSQLDWGENGGVIYKGETIPNTNISYLIREMVSPLKKFTPIGSDTFREILVEIGAPIPHSAKKDGTKEERLERLPPPPGIRHSFIKKKNKANKVKSWQKIF